jgi:hypothetical protein
MPETAEQRQGKIPSKLPINHHWRKSNMPLDTQLMNTGPAEDSTPGRTLIPSLITPSYRT